MSSIKYQFVAFDSKAAREIVAKCEKSIIERYSTSITIYPASDFASPKGCFVIAEVSGKAIACGGFRCLKAGVAELKRIYVDSQFRRQGIANKIIVILEEQAKELGYREIWLETAEKPIDACRLYEKLGYHEIPRFDEYVDLEGSRCFAKSL